MGRLIGRGGEVNAAVAWDPDGNGPIGEVLVVGGDFYLAGGDPVSNLAVWDGQSWSDLGGGLDREVTGLAVLQGTLHVSYAAGYWNRIVRWTGQSWQEVAPESGPILGVHNGELIAQHPYPAGTSAWNGGSWRSLGDPCGAQTIATHDGNLATAIVDHWNGCVAISEGSGWNMITGNLGGFPQFGQAFAMESGPGGLYLSGHFGVGNSYGIARWDGSQWNSVGAGGFVRDFHTFAGQIYAAGAMNGAGPVARWDGAQWQTIASEIAGPGSARVLCTYAGQLIAAGQFSGINSTPASSVARWDGVSWHALGLGVDLSDNRFGPAADILAVASSGSDLYIGGSFDRVGTLVCGSIARFNGAGWDNLQGGLASGAVEAMLMYNGELIIGGSFASVGGVPVNNIAAWTGSQWRPLGDGFLVNSVVWALGTYQGQLYAAGRGLDSAGNGLARWDGEAWQIVPTPAPDDVHAIAEFNGELYVGSSFEVPGGGRGLARWNGVEWLPVGSPGEYIYAHRLAVYNGELIVGLNTGTFPEGIVRWNGQAWGYIGALNSGRIRAMMVLNGELVVAGGFTAIEGVPASRIAAWNGTQWRAFGSGLQTDEPSTEARALTPYGSGFAVGGEFQSAGGQLSPHLAMWGTGTPACYANCDCSSAAPTLNIADFTCFLHRFAASHPYANCDGSTEAPVLNVADFTCYLRAFAGGCR